MKKLFFVLMVLFLTTASATVSHSFGGKTLSWSHGSEFILKANGEPIVSGHWLVDKAMPKTFNVAESGSFVEKQSFFTSGLLTERQQFIETEKVEEFPARQIVSFSPIDSEPHGLAWIITDFSLLSGQRFGVLTGICQIRFANSVLVDWCDFSSRVKKVTLTSTQLKIEFKEVIGEQDLKIKLIDPPTIVDNGNGAFEVKTNFLDVNITSFGKIVDFNALPLGDWNVFEPNWAFHGLNFVKTGSYSSWTSTTTDWNKDGNIVSSDSIKLVYTKATAGTVDINIMQTFTFPDDHYFQIDYNVLIPNETDINSLSFYPFAMNPFMAGQPGKRSPIWVDGIFNKHASTQHNSSNFYSLGYWHNYDRNENVIIGFRQIEPLDSWCSFTYEYSSANNEQQSYIKCLYTASGKWTRVLANTVLKARVYVSVVRDENLGKELIKLSRLIMPEAVGKTGYDFNSYWPYENTAFTTSQAIYNDIDLNLSRTDARMVYLTGWNSKWWWGDSNLMNGTDTDINTAMRSQMVQLVNDLNAIGVKGLIYTNPNNIGKANTGITGTDKNLYIARDFNITGTDSFRVASTNNYRSAISNLEFQDYYVNTVLKPFLDVNAWIFLDNISDSTYDLNQTDNYDTNTLQYFNVLISKIKSYAPNTKIMCEVYLPYLNCDMFWDIELESFFNGYLPIHQMKINGDRRRIVSGWGNNYGVKYGANQFRKDYKSALYVTSASQIFSSPNPTREAQFKEKFLEMQNLTDFYINHDNNNLWQNYHQDNGQNYYILRTGKDQNYTLNIPLDGNRFVWDFNSQKLIDTNTSSVPLYDFNDTVLYWYGNNPRFEVREGRDNNYNYLLDANGNLIDRFVPVSIASNNGQSVHVDSNLSMDINATVIFTLTGGRTCANTKAFDRYSHNGTYYRYTDVNFTCIGNVITIDLNDINPGTGSDILYFDTNAPVTSWDGNNNVWQNFDSNIHLTCTDNNSGCAQTRYKIDGGTWKIYDTNILIHTDGNHIIQFDSNDNAGNIEDTNTKYVLVDKTGASTTVSITTGYASYSFSLSCTDSNSGCKNTYYRLDTDYHNTTSYPAWVLYTGSVSMILQNYDQNLGIIFYSTDKVDNNGTMFVSYAILPKTSGAGSRDSIEKMVSSSISVPEQVALFLPVLILLLVFGGGYFLYSNRGEAGLEDSIKNGISLFSIGFILLLVLIIVSIIAGIIFLRMA